MLPFNSQTFVSRNPVRLAAEPAALPRHNLTRNQSIALSAAVSGWRQPRQILLPDWPTLYATAHATETLPNLACLPGKAHGCSCDVKRWPLLLVTLLLVTLLRTQYVYSLISHIHSPHVLTSGFWTVLLFTSAPVTDGYLMTMAPNDALTSKSDLHNQWYYVLAAWACRVDSASISLGRPRSPSPTVPHHISESSFMLFIVIALFIYRVLPYIA